MVPWPSSYTISLKSSRSPRKLCAGSRRFRYWRQPIDYDKLFASPLHDGHHVIMRYSAKHKEQTRSKLLKRASKRFREEGLQGTGIAKLMREMGLTHGGFYGHFRSKNDLVATAIRAMFAETIEDLKGAIAGCKPGEEIPAIVNTYLSAKNREHPELGCLLPTLAAEIARQPKAIRQAYTQGFTGQVERLAQFMPGTDKAAQLQNAQSLLAGMAGTMMFARAVSDRELSDSILAQARKSYILMFGSKASRTG